MNRFASRPALGALSLVVGATLSLAACGSSTTTPASAPTTAMADKGAPTTAMADKGAPTTAMADKGAAMAKGAYLSYADYQSRMASVKGSTVVLFFHAPWCPDCRATDTALTGSAVPDGLTVVKVDYDSMTELKQKYGVTQQHTFVQVDASGAQVKKWTGSKDAAAIKAQTA